MDIDVCYRVPKQEEFRFIKKYVCNNTIKLAIYSSVDDLYVNKKNIWNILDVLSYSGIVAILCPLRHMDTTLAAVRNITSHYDILIFDNSKSIIDTGPCFTETCVSMVIVYKNVAPVWWKLPNKDNEYGLNPCIIRDTDKMIPKLLEITDFGDVVLLVGDNALSYTGDIKNLCRSVIAIGHAKTEAVANEGVRIVNLGE